MHGITMICPDCGADAELINTLTGPMEEGTYVAHIYHCPECGIDILDDEVVPDQKDELPLLIF